MASGEDALKSLMSIEAKLSRITALLERIVQNIPLPIADDADLDGSFGDEEIKFLPRDWSGEDYKGRRMSATSAPFLEQMAKAFDYFAEKNDANNEKTDKGVPKSTYARRSAMRARGWAKRLREGYVSRAATASAVPESDDIQF